MDGVEVFFVGDPLATAAGVAASIIFRPEPKQELYFKGSVEFSQTAVSIGAQMLGTWKNAFTLRGWDLSDVGLFLGFLYGSPIPTRLGGAGTLFIKHGSTLIPQKASATIMPSSLEKKVGPIEITSPEDFSISTKFMADANLINLGFEGSVSRVITWYELIEICLRSMASRLSIDLSKVPSPLELKNVKVKYAPRDIKIGDQYLELGFGAKADFTLLGKKGKFDIHADFSGIKGFGTIEKIDIDNVLLITDAEGKGDPKVDIELSFDRQSFLITGRILLAEFIEALAKMEVSSSGFMFDFMSAVGKTEFEGKPLLLAQVRGNSSGTLKNPNFTVSLDFQQNLKRFITQQVNQQLRVAEKAIEDALNLAQSELTRINAVSKQADAKITQARNQLQKARSSLKKIQQAQEDAQSKLKTARQNVESIKKEIRNLDTWYNSLPAV